jgi:exodeoxyribonuclease VII small subunit
MNQPENIKEMRLEETMSRLEAVVKGLEKEGLPLEDAMKLYEEGIALCAACHEKLSEAERKIRILSVTPDGELTEEAFDTEQ